MEELLIKTTDFETSKKKLKSFSEQAPKALTLNRVENGSWFFGLGDHIVTGNELNKLISTIQSYLMDFNNAHIKLFIEFGQVVNTFEALDKNYIKAIIVAIKSAEKANIDLKIAQDDIKKTIDVQEKTIAALKKFKLDIEKNQYIQDINKFWEETNNLKEDANGLSIKIDSMFDFLDEVNTEIITLIEFQENIEKLKHLKNIDELWDDTRILKNDILDLIEKIREQKQIQIILTNYKEKLEKFKHLEDIDKLWNNTQSLGEQIPTINRSIEKIKLTSSDHKNAIDEHQRSLNLLTQFKNKIDNFVHLNKIDTIWDKSQTFSSDIIRLNEINDTQKNQIVNLHKDIELIKKQSEDYNNATSKKLKIVYALAGSSLGIAIIELFLIFWK